MRLVALPWRSKSFLRGGGGNGWSRIRPDIHGLWVDGRALMSETPLRRSIIRHMFIIIDLSESMRDKDFRPSRWVSPYSEAARLMRRRWDVTLQYIRSYVTEWFDQNPLGQQGVILLRDRLSEVLVPMGGELNIMPRFRLI